MLDNKEEVYYTVILCSIFLLLLIGIIITTAILYNNRRKRYLLERSKFENVILTTQLEIQEQTFKNISQEIHDNIGQILSLAKINLAAIEEGQGEGNGPSDAGKDKEKRLIENVIMTKNLVTKAIQDLRNLSHGLNTDYISNMGLARALEHEVETIRKSGHFEVVYSLKGIIRSLDVQRELIVFRIVQELLNNSIKHSDATMLAIEMDFEENYIRLTVSDNGKGLDLEKIMQNKEPGMGILNVYNRVKLVHGMVIFDGLPGEGTTATITLPYHIS